MILDRIISISITKTPAISPEVKRLRVDSSYSLGKATKSEAGINTVSRRLVSSWLVLVLIIFHLPRQKPSSMMRAMAPRRA